MSLLRPTSWNIATMPAPSNPIWGEKFLMKKEKGDDADDDDDFPSHCVGSIYNEPRNANPPTL